MATGEPPWSQFKNQITAIYNIMNATEPPTIPDNLSEHLKSFLRCCFQLNPKERLNVYKLLRHPFITGGDNKETLNEGTKKVNSDKNLDHLRKNSKKKERKDIGGTANLFQNEAVNVSTINPLFESIGKPFLPINFSSLSISTWSL